VGIRARSGSTPVFAVDRSPSQSVEEGAPCPSTRSRPAPRRLELKPPQSKRLRQYGGTRMLAVCRHSRQRRSRIDRQLDNGLSPIAVLLSSVGGQPAVSPTGCERRQGPGENNSRPDPTQIGRCSCRCWVGHHEVPHCNMCAPRGSKNRSRSRGSAHATLLRTAQSVLQAEYGAYEGDQAPQRRAPWRWMPGDGLRQKGDGASEVRETGGSVLSSNSPTDLDWRGGHESSLWRLKPHRNRPTRSEKSG